MCEQFRLTSMCEACELVPAQCVEPCDDAETPYRLCMPCHGRLRSLSLRPLEWYNLAKRHSWQRFLLHDDFYEEDGTATAPEEDLESPEVFPSPSLAAVSHDPRLLLDYSITRWYFDSNTAATWSAFPRSDILKALSERFESTRNIEVRSRVLEICATSLGEFGSILVRYAWNKYPTTVSLIALTEASASCLPFHEGFPMVTAALSKLSGSRKRDLIFCLGYFQATAALDWIEEHIFEPITEDWGRLAAASKLDWPRAERWLEGGRPLSLVALDALSAIIHPRTPFLQSQQLRLHSPPTSQRLIQVLTGYAEKDGVPRVQQRTNTLIEHAARLTEIT